MLLWRLWLGVCMDDVCGSPAGLKAIKGFTHTQVASTSRRVDAKAACVQGLMTLPEECNPCRKERSGEWQNRPTLLHDG